jgi:hypothetical protein
VQRHAEIPAGRRRPGHRLQRADLVVRGHQAGQRGTVRGRGERGDVHPPVAVHRHADRLAAGRDVPFGGVQHAGVLDRGMHEPGAGAAAAGQAAEDRQVGGLRAGRAEGQLVRAGAEHLGDLLPGAVEQQPGPAAGPVQLGRVGPAVRDRGGQRLGRGRMQRHPRRRVQIHAAHPPDPPAPTPPTHTSGRSELGEGNGAGTPDPRRASAGSG